MLVRGMNNAPLHREVFPDELSGVGVVRHDAAHAGGGKVDLAGFLFFEEGAHLARICEIELSMRPPDDGISRIAPSDQVPDNCTSDHPQMARNVNLCHGVV